MGARAQRDEHLARAQAAWRAGRFADSCDEMSKADALLIPAMDEPRERRKHDASRDALDRLDQFFGATAPERKDAHNQPGNAGHEKEPNMATHTEHTVVAPATEKRTARKHTSKKAAPKAAKAPAKSAAPAKAEAQRVTLHSEIVAVLTKKGAPMSAEDVAAAVTKRAAWKDAKGKAREADAAKVRSDVEFHNKDTKINAEGIVSIK